MFCESDAKSYGCVTLSPVHSCHLLLYQHCTCVHFRRALESQAKRCFHICHHIGLHRSAHCALNPQLLKARSTATYHASRPGECLWQGLQVHLPHRSETGVCAAPWEPCDTRIWQKCDDGWVASKTTRSGWQGSRAVQVMFVLGVEHARRKCDDRAPRESRELHCRMTRPLLGQLPVSIARGRT